MHLSTKLSIIRHALEENLLKKTQGGYESQVGLLKTYDFRVFGDSLERRPIRQVLDWAQQSVVERWNQLGEDIGMISRYGENPLGRIRRVPTKWCRQMKTTFRKTKKNADSAPLRRGRRKYLEMYPEGMKQCTDELVRDYNEAKSSDPPVAPGLSQRW